MKNYLIIGNGTAAIGCVEGIRSVDKVSPITIVSAEKYAAYCRPLISYYLEDRTDEKKMKYRSDSFYKDNNCIVIYGKSATSIDAKNKICTLNDGKTLDYTEMCIATGSSPFLPPMENINKVKNHYSFLTLSDAIKLKKAIKPNSKVLIIGAGLIGLKCAEGLHETTKNIVVCDLADRVLSSILDVDGASIVQKHLESNGLQFILGDSVAYFNGNTAIMKSGKTVDFDILVTAVGVRANIGIFKDAGGICGRGITVDVKMKTSIDDIYSAGDCTESVDITDNNVKIMALMPNAYMQGFTAGVNMADGDKEFDNAIPMNSIGFFGLHIMTAGSKHNELINEISENSMRKIYVNDGYLTGFQIIGDVKSTGILTNLIRNKIKLEEADLTSIGLMPELNLFGETYRKKVLGSVV